MYVFGANHPHSLYRILLSGTKTCSICSEVCPCLLNMMYWEHKIKLIYYIYLYLIIEINLILYLYLVF